MEELLQSLKDQLANLDFVKELEKVEAYEDYYFEADADQESPEFQRHQSKESSLVYNKKEPNLQSIKEERPPKGTTKVYEEESSSESGEDFLSSLGFKDPFHKQLQISEDANLRDARLEFPSN